MHLSCGRPSLVEDQALHVIGEINEHDLGFITLDADGADIKPHMRFLLHEDMFDECPDLRFDTVRFACAVRHCFASGLLAVDAAHAAMRLKPGLIFL